jgi:hypothetical protein
MLRRPRPKRLGGLLIARARTALDERRFDNALAELKPRAASTERCPPRRSRRAPGHHARQARSRRFGTLAAQNFDRAQICSKAQKDALLPPAQIAQLSRISMQASRRRRQPPGGERRVASRMVAS